MVNKISTDPAVRKAKVDGNAVYLKPSLYKIIVRSLEINEALYQKEYGRKFVSSIEKDQASK